MVHYDTLSIILLLLALLGFKPIPDCATLDSCVSDQEDFVILYTEFKWRIEVHCGQNASKNNDLLKNCFE